MTLNISMKTASADLADSAITKAITMLAVSIAKAKRDAAVEADATQSSGSRQNGALPSGPALDITFMLPGKLEKPGFSGMRMGGYETEEKTLYFEIAVPEHIVHSAQSHLYTVTALQDVIANANDFFSDNQLQFNALHWQQFVNKILSSSINS